MTLARTFTTSGPVRWSDIDTYQHVNHATMVTILEEARVDQLRLVDSPLQVSMWVIRVRAVDFTVGYEVRAAGAGPASRPAVVAETQLATVHIEEQRLQRLTPAQRDYLCRWTR